MWTTRVLAHQLAKTSSLSCTPRRTLSLLPASISDREEQRPQGTEALNILVVGAHQATQGATTHERDCDRQLLTGLELLMHFPDAELYRRDGCRIMVQWIDQWLNVGRIVASERLRIGRTLQNLLTCDSLIALD